MQVNVQALIAQTIVIFALFALALFLPAGTASWLEGWLFLILFLVFYVALMLWLIPRNPGLVQERMRLGTSDQKGPYHWVRHPMYAAILVFVVGTSLLLGSWYGLGFGLLLIVLLARRAMLEEGMLVNELEGYDAYRTQVKYRLIPYIW